MWYEKVGVKHFHEIFKPKQPNEINHFVSEILNIPPASKSVPTNCPRCQAVLVRKAIPYVELVAYVCPSSHGLWITSEVQNRLRQFIHEQIKITRRKRWTARILGFLIAFTLIASNSQLLNPLKTCLKTIKKNVTSKLQSHGILTTPRSINNSITMTPFQMDEQSIGNPDELVFLHQWAIVITEALINKNGFVAVLNRERSPDKLWLSFRSFQERHNEIIRYMEMLHVPKTLKRFHSSILNALQSQVLFYMDFVDGKIQNPQYSVAKAANNRFRIKSLEELRNARIQFLQLYPTIEPKTLAALEERLDALVSLE